MPFLNTKMCCNTLTINNLYLTYCITPLFLRGLQPYNLHYSSSFNCIIPLFLRGLQHGNGYTKIGISVLHPFFKGYYNASECIADFRGVYYTPFLRGITDNINITIKGKKAT